MKVTFNIEEAINELKNGEVLCTSFKNQFVYKNEKIVHYFNGSVISMNIDNFIELYGNELFYLYEDNDTSIDDSKDEAYYRYYRK